MVGFKEDEKLPVEMAKSVELAKTVLVSVPLGSTSTAFSYTKDNRWIKDIKGGRRLSVGVPCWIKNCCRGRRRR